MSTGADAPFHPDHLYQAPYDAAAHKRIAALVVENDRLIAHLDAALGALRELADLCAPKARRTAGDDETWEKAVRQARATLEPQE